MIYASERDAKLGSTLGADAVWRRSGSTGVCELRTADIDCGTAMPTVVISLDDVQRYLGTSINAAIPLPFHTVLVQPSTELALTTPADMVEHVRKVFGLNVTQLAQTLHIERITVYAWLRTDRMEKLNPTNRHRLWQVFHVSRMWSKFAPLAGKYLVEPIPGRNTTLLDMLRGPDPATQEFAQAYELLARATGPTARVQRHRLEQRASLKKGIDNLRKNADKFGMDLS